jgi:hypothetical protein
VINFPSRRNARASLGVLTVVLALALIAGCGTDPGPGPVSATTAQHGPITQRAIAAIMLKHLPENTTSRTALYTDSNDPEGLLGAELRYGGDGETDGDPIIAALAPGEYTHRGPRTQSAPVDTSVPGASLTLLWETEEPEEDGGIVRVVLQHPDEYAVITLAGPRITADPRQMDLPVTVDDLVKLVEDPQLRLQTTPEALEAGRSLEGWDGQ